MENFLVWIDDSFADALLLADVRPFKYTVIHLYSQSSADCTIVQPAKRKLYYFIVSGALIQQLYSHRVVLLFVYLYSHRGVLLFV